MKEQAIHWETSGTSRIPFAVYTQPDTHAKELERFFYKAHWSYVGLEAEIPNLGDFKRTVIGERSVIMTRSQDGHVYVVENVCAHRGMAFCRERHGNKKRTCVSLPPVELCAGWQIAGRAIQARRSPRRQGQWRHAGRF